MEPEALADLIEEYARAGEPAADQTAGRACATLLRRGVGGDMAAVQALRRQFGPIVRAWVAAHPLGSGDDQERAAVAERMFDELHEHLSVAEIGPEASLTELLAWLKLAVFTTLVRDARQQAMGPTPPAGAAAWSALAARLPDRRQQRAVYLAVVSGLRPRAIARQRPEIFPTAVAATQALRLGLDTLRTEQETPDAPACVAPGALDDDDLVAAASGETSRRVREHLRDCPSCAARAAAYREQLDRLRAGLFRADCPAPSVVGRYAAGRLSPTGTDAGHIARCLICQAEAATAAGFLDTPPTEDLLLLRRLRRVVARPLPAARGRRGAISLRYEAGDVSLTLHPQRADKPRDQIQILGFVEQAGATLASLAGAPVRLLARGQLVARARLDTIGSFTLGPVAPGSYDLEVDTSEGVIVVPSLPAWLET
jgi:hypothetical protein